MTGELTSLGKHGAGLVLLDQRLHLLRLEGRVEDLVEARVSLPVVDEVGQLLHRQVGPTLRPAVRQDRRRKECEGERKEQI